MYRRIRWWVVASFLTGWGIGIVTGSYYEGIPISAIIGVLVGCLAVGIVATVKIHRILEKEGGKK